ncbi:MAG: hypothetical protein C0402_05210 [Thermodesulfovibrio sp.]|nr:hypothetical protein [Thermodesulfovibrio sp.]
MKKVVAAVLLYTSLILSGCGGSGSAVDSGAPPPIAPPYSVKVQQETQLTNNKWNQGLQSAAFGGGVYMLVWMDDRDNTDGLSGEDIWGAIVDQSLQVIKEFPIFKRPGRDMNPKVIYDPIRSKFAVVWTSYNGLDLGHSDVMGAFVDTTGSVISAGSLGISQQYAEEASIKVAGNGYAILFRDTWVENVQTIGSKVLKLAVTDENFVVSRSTTVTGDTVDGVQVIPMSPTFDCGPDRCLVTYNMIKNIIRSDGSHIYGRFVSLSDGALGPELQLSEQPAGKAASKTSPTVAYGGGRYLVTWDDSDSAQGLVSIDLTGRFVSPDGVMGSTMVVSDFRWDHNADIKTGLNGAAGNGAIAYRPGDDAFVVIWSDSRTGTPLDSGLFMRKINVSGADSSCTLINNMPGNQAVPAAVMGSNNQIFVSWSQSAVRSTGDATGFYSADIFGLLLQ